MTEKYRAIIIKNNQILLMQRTFEGREFYVFPGGEKEPDETAFQCCKRELKEEFGIEINVGNMIYRIHQADSEQGFFVCEWVKGAIHKTDAEEYLPNNAYGTYEPVSLPLKQLPTIDLLPTEVKLQLQKDIKEYGIALNRPLIEFDCEYKK